MILDEAIERYTNNAEYERTHGSLQGCLEFRQLVKWLKDYKRLLEQQSREDCISRQAALKELKESAEHHANDSREEVLLRRDRDIIRVLPSVTQKSGTCKDCKWWRDSDGVYRRGIGAESKCPINNVSVNHGLGYCFMFEPQESEDKE